MQKLKVEDEVVVLAGKDRGKTGKIVKLDLKNKKVLVSGVNMMKKTMATPLAAFWRGWIQIQCWHSSLL